VSLFHHVVQDCAGAVTEALLLQELFAKITESKQQARQSGPGSNSEGVQIHPHAECDCSPFAALLLIPINACFLVKAVK
jgi:hypothetical protein